MELAASLNFEGLNWMCNRKMT